MSPSDEIFDNCFSPSKDSLFLRGTEQGRSSTFWRGDGTPERWARVSTWFSSWKSVLLDSSFSSWNIFFLCLPICWPYKATDLKSHRDVSFLLGIWKEVLQSKWVDAMTVSVIQLARALTFLGDVNVGGLVWVQLPAVTLSRCGILNTKLLVALPVPQLPHQ